MFDSFSLRTDIVYDTRSPGMIYKIQIQLLLYYQLIIAAYERFWKNNLHGTTIANNTLDPRLRTCRRYGRHPRRENTIILLYFVLLSI